MKITSGIERTVATIDENESVRDAAQLMTDKYIGSVVVTSHARIVGLITEREVMMRVLGQERDPAKIRIRDVMRSDDLKIASDATCEEALQRMKENRCRHLLVFHGDEFVGLVSLRDIVLLVLQEKDDLIEQLKRYITAA